MASQSTSKPSNARRKPGQIAAEAEAQALARHVDSAHKTYGRGEDIRPKSVRDKKLRSKVKALQSKAKDAEMQAKDAEILMADATPGMLEAENELEKTYKVRQDDIRSASGVETAKKGFELRLEGLGPYDVCEYTRNGRDLLIAGRKGHVACFDWRAGKLGCELNLNETVRDAKWLHTNQSFAVAQKKCVYIYARDGVELHALKKLQEPVALQFLPYHFLLASISTLGVLRYTDISTGANITEFATKLGPPTSFCQNPANAILHVGHQKGLVTLWSPNSSTPLVKLLPHSGPVRSLAIDRAGRYMVSAGQDRRMSVWDIRMFKEMHTHHLRQPGASLSISDQNLTAVGWGTQVSIFNQDIFTRAKEDIKVPEPYMSWGGEGNTISRLKFCPFEDVLGISHDKGFSSIIVPGSGEPNFDALESGLNPFETSKQRKEAEVHALLEKLQPEMISLDPNIIGNLDLASEEQRRRERDLDAKPEDKIANLKKKGRGRNSALRRHLRKSGQKNVIDAEKVRAREALQAMNKREIEKVSKMKAEYGPALARFARKGF
ncbi:BING4CT-domain-containing protein [Aaosphaeria arxii CBS 175.79]|uniref:U three protein 7 n=1 Tax=Aaosphaeria arxii CBS 175.79 TaxID=1450172 RepID=A0A6A5XX93_9PLEO|nr:BING4CT-domain-containing protein [Aaosphaeria arxii CBS 175.79]KAF2017260.1 BING4CT-domain-containing protein [Aaosphaeria arxii CBS 175.79]